MPATIITVTSGKGGVGKTTSSAAIGTALALRGKRVCVADFDVGLRNLDLAFGVERRVVFDMVQVMQGKAKLGQALIRDKRVPTLSILPTSQTHDKDVLTPEGVASIMDQLREIFDYVICDSPAGIEHGAVMALYHADHAIVVTNPEVSSVRDSDRMLGMIASRSRRAEQGLDPVQEHLLITRYDEERVNRGQMMPVKDIEEILNAELLGIIPESKDILEASNNGSPASLDDTTAAGRAYREAVARLLKEDVGAPSPVPTRTRSNWLTKIFGNWR